jgi:hypothetical protein
VPSTLFSAAAELDKEGITGQNLLVEDETGRKADRDMKLHELTTVMGPVEAEVIRTFLESQGIPCILRGRMAQSIYPFSVDGMGEIKILVSEADYDAAEELLKERPPKEEE